MAEIELKALFKAKCEELGIEYSDERFALTQSLGQVMSDASELYIFAGWFGDWCVAVAEGIAKGETGFISEHAPIIKLAADHLGHYADMADYPLNGYLPRRPLEEARVIGKIYVPNDEYDAGIEGIQIHDGE